MRLARTAAPLPRAIVGEPMVPHAPPPFGSCTVQRHLASRAAKPPSGPELAPHRSAVEPSAARRGDCRQGARIWSAGFEPAISDARSRRGGQAPLRPVSASRRSSPAGIEPATRGVEALCSSAELRGDRRPWNRTTLHRLIRAAPAQSACRRISPGGFEPPSPTVAGWCSVPLSYGEKSFQRSRRESNPPSPGRQPGRAPGASESLQRNGAPGNRTPPLWLQATFPTIGSPPKSDRRDSNPVCGAGNAVCLRHWHHGRIEHAPSGARTRVTGVRDRHPGRLDDRGVSTDGRNRTFSRGVGNRLDAMSSSV